MTPTSTPSARPPARRGRKPDVSPDKSVDAVTIRPIRRGDLDHVIALDATVTGREKRAYWRSVYKRYSTSGQAGGQFLVAAAGGRVRGFIIGEVRDWEFGSAPCGWVFAIDVEPDFRLAGIGTRLLTAICACFRRAGVTKVRTMLARDNTLILSFFRSQGMMAGPFIPLEMDLLDGRQTRDQHRIHAMRLQKNSSLAIYSALEFAADPTRHISAAEIADKYGLSVHHLAKVLSELVRAGIVESARGVGGGYRFAGNARRITLMDLIKTFEAPGLPDSGQREPVDRTPVGRALSAVLAEIDEIARATLCSITLATMLRPIERQQRAAATPAKRRRLKPP